MPDNNRVSLSKYRFEQADGEQLLNAKVFLKEIENYLTMKWSEQDEQHL